MRFRQLLVAMAAFALVLAACGDDDDGAVDASGDESSEEAGGESGTTDATPGEQAADATVAVATDDQLGEYLVDAEGRTLYLFIQDDGTTTACTGSCVEVWPPLVADGEATGAEGIDTAELGTADGIEPGQVTYHGHLLYYYAGDQSPGEINGTSIADWYAVSPGGDQLGNAGSSGDAGDSGPNY